MIYLRTGTPGAGKTLNTLKELCSDPNVTQKQKFYNNVKAFMLDLDFCNSFQGFFYGVYFPSVQGTPKEKKYRKTIKNVHTEERLMELGDVPWLAFEYGAYDESAAIDLFVKWCRTCYPKQNLKALDEYLESATEVTVEGLKFLNYHFTKMLDPSDWPNLPNGSVAFFDECQDFFPPINSAAKKPESYDRFRTHRHKGVDIHLITQHGSFVDTIIRFTCNRHVHFFNPNNGDKLKRFQKNKYFDVDNSTAREACEITTVTRDKSFYGVYWSADEHTAKFKLPKAYITIAVLVAVMLFVAYRFISNINAMGEVDDKKEPDKQTVVKSKKIPVQQKLEAKKVIYTDVVNHPLDKLCTSYEYAGHQVVKKGNLVDVRHFINCVIGNQKEEKKIVLTNDDGSEDQQTVVEPKIKLLSQNYLKHLGYKIYLLDDTPVLKFANQEFYLHQF